MSEKKALNAAETEEAFHRAALVAHGLLGLFTTLEEGGPEQSTPQEVFALWEEAEALRTILARAYCGDEELSANTAGIASVEPRRDAPATTGRSGGGEEVSR